MVRFIVLLLLVIVGALVVALFFDHRSRRDARIDRLRWAFLHGSPLAGYTRPSNLAEVVHPGGMRFRAPASWTIEMAESKGAVHAGAPEGARRVRVEVRLLDGPAPAGTESVAEALKTLEAEGERSVEVLPNGHVLMKTLEPARSEKGLVASYVWRLGRVSPPRGVEIAVFRLGLPVEAAGEVIAQSDLATLDREIREAAFSG